MTKTSKQVEIDFNPEFQRALGLMEDTAQNLLITGRAGADRRRCNQCNRPDDSFFLSLQAQCYTGIDQKEKEHGKRKDHSL